MNRYQRGFSSPTWTPAILRQTWWYDYLPHGLSATLNFSGVPASYYTSVGYTNQNGMLENEFRHFGAPQLSTTSCSAAVVSAPRGLLIQPGAQLRLTTGGAVLAQLAWATSAPGAAAQRGPAQPDGTYSAVETGVRPGANLEPLPPPAPPWASTTTTRW
jgi:hypothetical protein